jgi:hypothetical protein
VLEMLVLALVEMKQLRLKMVLKMTLLLMLWLTQWQLESALLRLELPVADSQGRAG